MIIDIVIKVILIYTDVDYLQHKGKITEVRGIFAFLHFFL